MPGTLPMDVKSVSLEAVPVLAGVGLVGSMALVDWTSLTANATGGLLLAGTIGASITAGVHYAISKYDQIRINRQKLYDDHNRESLSAQVAALTRQATEAAAASARNQDAMRASLHDLRNEAHAAKLEANQSREDLSTLREQFMAVARQLHETEMTLHKAHDELQRTNLRLQEAMTALATNENERLKLRQEIDSITRRGRRNSARLKKLEGTSSGETAALDRNTASTDQNTAAVDAATRPALNGGTPAPPA